MLGVLLIILSFCTYPVFVRIPAEEITLWHRAYTADIFMYYRSFLLPVGALILIPTIKKIRIGFVVLFFLLALSSFLSQYPHVAMFGITNYYEGFLVLLAYLIILAQKNFPEKEVSVAVVIVAVFAILQVVYQSYFYFPPIHKLIPKWMTFETRLHALYSTLGNPNHLGLFCSLLFPFFLNKKRYVLATILLVLVVGSQTRGAWLACFVTTLIGFRHYWKRVMVVTALCLIPVYPRVVYTVRNKDLTSRILIWKESIPMLSHTLTTGKGPGAYELDFRQEETKNTFGNKIVGRPHNMLLSVWYATGLISVATWALLLFDFFKTSKDKAKKMGILGFLIAGIFTDSVVSVTPYFMAMLGSEL